ncbi:MAG: dienelactone hydrolase [Candidatus Taylorbacteria bacterium RIFCSPHIGHO2_01_FULL_51_15]|uniref:Dienelactone hydrolase n=1 Tax=Candidatus Taylorbacteria bacterium RIFCSPHIGHO2_01_FULL_51_15 TaxID=1802304 RepID=A0A1G2MB17_9BACT|nr:MAG: dienelactone hydrolase [Candidatus Taylorbacteria bacterium RIFCSPHIGHO2_01_FULL_51_15]
MSHNIETGWVELSVSDGTEMSAYMAHRTGVSNLPGLIVIQEAFGVNAHIRDVALRFAKEGYAAIAPDLYHRTASRFEGAYTDFDAIQPHRTELTDARLEADLSAAHMWLLSQEFVDKERVAAVGYCMGGRAAYVANATLPLRAAVSYYGGRIAPDLLPRAKDMHGPILLCWGGLDNHIPPEAYRAVSDALREAKKPYVEAVFSEGDHGFFCDERPSYNPKAAREAWVLTLQFLKDNLA